MKRLLVIFGVALLCLSLCVNVVFASDVIDNSYSQNILVYFPWFGGVSGSSANRVTNYATVTTSDVSVTGSLEINNIITFNPNNLYGLNYSVDDSTINIYGTANTGGATVAPVLSRLNVVSGHSYVILSNADNHLIMRNDTTGAYTSFNQNVFFTSDGSNYSLRYYVLNNGSEVDVTWSINLVDVTDLGVTSVSDFNNLINSFGLSFPLSVGVNYASPVSSFSLVPAPAANGGASEHIEDDYTWYQYEADISLVGTGISSYSIADYLYDEPYAAYLNTVYNSVVGTGSRDSIIYRPISWSDNGSQLIDGSTYNITDYNKKIHVMVDPDKLGLQGIDIYNYYQSGNPVNDGYSVIGEWDIWIDDTTDLTYTHDTVMEISSWQNYIFNEDVLLNKINAERVVSDNEYTLEGTYSIDRIFRVHDNSYFLFNNQVNLGTYDFNVNVKFPSLEKFNNFSGYWLASFNTSWGEIPVRTQIQEVSSNSDTLIKIYKLTFDVPFTGQYTKFNIKYVGDSSAFTTIRVDSSVIDPNGYLNGAGPTTINGLSFYLTSMFDKFWGKIRSLFFDQDQTMAESVPVEAGQLAEEVSSGAQTIHEFETNNFDSIEQQQEDLDWDIPLDFGQASNPTSALGFIATVFSGVFFALGSKVTPIIVIPLMLGLCLLILGRGSLALGRLANNRRK